MFTVTWELFTSTATAWADYYFRLYLEVFWLDFAKHLNIKQPFCEVTGGGIHW